MTRSSAPSNAPYHGLCLKALPLEVQNRILSYFAPDPSDPDSYYDCLFLAEAIPHIRSAILKSLSFRFCVTRRITLLERWAAVLRPSLRELDIRVHPRAPNPGLLSLLEVRNLTRVSMLASHDRLHALQGAPYLRFLSLTVRSQTDALLAFECFKSWPRLEDLTLRLEGKSVCSLLPHSGRISLACPNIQKLDIKCLCGRPDNCPAWHFAAALPNIRHLVVRQQTPTRLYNPFRYEPIRRDLILLPRMERMIKHFSVDIDSLCTSCEVLFSDSSEAFSPTNSSFSVWPGIVEAENDECRYTYVTFPYQTKSFESFEVRGSLGKNLCIGSIQHHAIAMPTLSVLSLEQINVKRNELGSILEAVGTRLKKFATTIEFQEEKGYDRLSWLFQVLGKFNPFIQELSVNTRLFVESQGFDSIHPSERLIYQDELRVAYIDFSLKCPHVHVVDRHHSRVISYAELEHAVFDIGWNINSDSDISGFSD